MITQITVQPYARSYVAQQRVNYEKNKVNKYNNDFSLSSEIVGKDISVRCGTVFVVGKDSGETLSVGTVSEVRAGSKDVSTQVAQELIDRKYAIDSSP